MKTENNFNLRTTQSILHSITPSKQLQNQIIDDGLTKSYMFHAAAKSKRKQPIQRISDYEKAHEAIRQSNVKEKRNKIFRSIMRVSNTTTKYRLLMSNVVARASTFNCCDAKDVREPVVVIISEWKEITIKNAKQTELKYHFNFNTIEAKVEFYDIDTQSFMLEISKQIILKFENSQKSTSHAAESLKNDLKRMIDNSLGLQYHMNDLKQITDFQKMNYKPASQFGQHCETGDILLFRGNLFWAKVQRFVLNSDYDHVGMIYKDPDHGILIFESTSANGICLSPWDYVLKYKWYNFIQRITWRKLEKVQRDYNFMSKMQQLIIQNLGKNYDISLEKILSNQSYIHPSSRSRRPSSRSNSQNQQQKFVQKPAQRDEKQQQLLKVEQNKKQPGSFCSELIAKIYKGMNLISNDKKSPSYKPSCNYYPYHFTKKFPLQLQKGELSQQYIIHFNQQQIQDCYNFKL